LARSPSSSTNLHVRGSSMKRRVDDLAHSPASLAIPSCSAARVPHVLPADPRASGRKEPHRDLIGGAFPATIRVSSPCPASRRPSTIPGQGSNCGRRDHGRACQEHSVGIGPLGRNELARCYAVCLPLVINVPGFRGPRLRPTFLWANRLRSRRNISSRCFVRDGVSNWTPPECFPSPFSQTRRTGNPAT